MVVKLFNSLLQRGLTWWLRELASLLPLPWQQRLSRFDRMPLYCWRDATLMPSEDSAQSGHIGSILIGLDSDSVQLVRLKLPEAAEPDLRQTVSLQLSRHTPFLPDQVVFDCVVETRVPQSQRLEVLLAIVPKTLVADVLTTAQEHGLVVGRLSVLNGSGETCLPLNFLAQGDKHAQQGRSLWLRGGILAGVLLLLGLGTSVWSEYQALQELEAQANEMSSTAMEAISLQNELHVLTTRARFLGETREYTNSLAWLTELTRALPDEVWLSEVQRTEAEIRIVGEAADAFALIGLIDASPRFEQSRFTAPVRRDGLKENFDLTLTLVPKVTADASAQTHQDRR